MGAIAGKAVLFLDTCHANRAVAARGFVRQAWMWRASSTTSLSRPLAFFAGIWTRTNRVPEPFLSGPHTADAPPSTAIYCPVT